MGYHQAKSLTSGPQMNVVILHGSNDVYGASRVLLAEVAAYLSLGHHVTVVLPMDGPLTSELQTLSSAVRVCVEPDMAVIRKSDLLGSLRQTSIPSVVQEADVAVLWTLALGRYSRKLVASGIPFYFSVHEFLPGVLGAALVRFALGGGDFLIQACSHTVAAWLAKCGIASERVVVSYPHIPVPELRQERTRREDSFTVAVVGRVNGAKGHLEVVRAFSSAALAPKSKWRLLLCGMPFRGQEAFLHELLEAMKGDSRIAYLGEIDGLGEVAAEVDVVACFPKRPESLGLVPLEARALGLLATGYAFGGLSESLRLARGIPVAPNEGEAGIVRGCSPISGTRC